MSIGTAEEQKRRYYGRVGRLTRGQKQAIESLAQSHCLTGPVDFESLFPGHDRRVIEIGFGMGDGLLQMAKANPTAAFIGIEVYQPGVGALLKGINEQGLGNLRAIHGDAWTAVETQFADNSLDSVKVFFPDPWPKKRHFKRRLLQGPFFDLLAKKLRADGHIHIATDWTCYAESLQEEASKVASLVERSPEGCFPSRPSSKYERRGERLGHPIYDFYYGVK